MKKTILAIVALLAALPAAAAVPPPPPVGAMARWQRVAAAPDKNEIDAYVLLFEPGVQIIVNDRRVAGSRGAWKAYLINNLAFSTKRRLTSYGNPTLVADSVFYPFNGCCLHTRFGVYHFDDQGLVDEVRFTDGGTFWDGSLEP